LIIFYEYLRISAVSISDYFANFLSRHRLESISHLFGYQATLTKQPGPATATNARSVCGHLDCDRLFLRTQILQHEVWPTEASARAGGGGRQLQPVNVAFFSPGTRAAKSFLVFRAYVHYFGEIHINQWF